MSRPESGARPRLPAGAPSLHPGGGACLRADFGAGLDARALLPAAIAERRVALVAGSAFPADPEPPAARGTMRRGASRIPPERPPEATARLEGAIRSAGAGVAPNPAPARAFPPGSRPPIPAAEPARGPTSARASTPAPCSRRPSKSAGWLSLPAASSPPTRSLLPLGERCAAALPGFPRERPPEATARLEGAVRSAAAA